MGIQSGKRREDTLAKMAEAKVPVTMRDFFFDDPFFKRSWDDFDKVRDAMFQESRDMWKRFDEDFRDSACMKNNIMLEPGMELGKELSKEEARSLARQDSKARYEEGWMFPRRWMLPSLNAPLKQLDLFNSKDSELIRTKEDDSKMEVSLDTAQYRPDELKITVDKEARGEGGGREQDGEQELLQEVHPARGRQARRCGLESLLRRRSRHHRSKKCPSNHKCEGGPEVRFQK